MMHRWFAQTLGRVVAAAAFIGLVGGVSPGAAQAQNVRAGTPPSGTGSAVTTAKVGSTGALVKVGQIKPQAAVAPRRESAAKATPHALPLRRPQTYGQAAAPHLAPAVPRGTTVTGAAPALLHNFDGVNSTDSLNVNGFGVEPADEGMAVGNGFVVNNVNVAFTIYATSGQVLVGPISDAAFFNELQLFTPGTGGGDPRVSFDAADHRWFMTMFVYDDGTVSGTAGSHLDIAVSDSGDPTRTWTEYQIDTTDSGDPGCPCLPDFPIQGLDQFNLYLSTNEFSIAGTDFNGAQIYAIPKAALESRTATARYVHYGNLYAGGSLAFHVQPAMTHGRASAEYFMSSLDPYGTYDTRLAVWALDDPERVARGDVPTLSAIVINSEAYSFPVTAQTPPGYNGLLDEATTGLIDAGFDAMQEVEFIDGHLLGALGTAVAISGDSAIRDGIAWFDVAPDLNHGSVTPETAVTAQGYIGAAGLDLLYPHIERNPQGLTAMVFSYGGLNTYLSAGYATMPAFGSNFGPISTVAAGVAPDNGFTATPDVSGVGRWGDYSAGQFDAAGNLWLATQYIPGPGDVLANWGNRIFALQR